jgi:hypothetical protein
MEFLEIAKSGCTGTLFGIAIFRIIFYHKCWGASDKNRPARHQRKKGEEGYGLAMLLLAVDLRHARAATLNTGICKQISNLNEAVHPSPSPSRYLGSGLKHLTSTQATTTSTWNPASPSRYCKPANGRVPLQPQAATAEPVSANGSATKPEPVGTLAS